LAERIRNGYSLAAYNNAVAINLSAR